MEVSQPNHPITSIKRSVLLVDDHPVLREGLAKLINEEDDLVVCGEAQTQAGAMAAVQKFKPDVVVVDLALSEGHGIELIKDIRAVNPHLPIVVFTMFDDPAYALHALGAGAQGYITKQEPSEHLISALKTVLAGQYALAPRFSKLVLESKLIPGAPSDVPVAALGARELEVFGLLGTGLGTSQIAHRLGRSVKTIETYRARIKHKLHLDSSNQLVREAVRWVDGRQ